MQNLFFKERSFIQPNWLKQKISRRQMLKSAAGATAVAAMPSFAFTASDIKQFEQAINTAPWNTLNAVMEHLLPESDSGPSAKNINATFYLHQLVFKQPTAQDEIDFIFKGVGWLNGFTQNKLKQNFIDLLVTEKETMLRQISQSSAGENWLNMMILNIYEAMLSPPAYGGNPDGIGWKWLDHQAGFPLPTAGKRYFELPQRSQSPDKNKSIIESKDLLTNEHLSLLKGSNSKGANLKENKA